MITIGLNLKLYWNWLVDFAMACWETYMAWKRGDVEGCIDEAGDVWDLSEDALDYWMAGECDVEDCDEEDCDGCILIELPED